MKFSEMHFIKMQRITVSHCIVLITFLLYFFVFLTFILLVSVATMCEWHIGNKGILIDWFVDWLIDWLVDWLIHSFIDYTDFSWSSPTQQCKTVLNKEETVQKTLIWASVERVWTLGHNSCFVTLCTPKTSQIWTFP